MGPRRSTAMRGLASTRARVALLIVTSALLSVIALAVLHSPHGVVSGSSQVVAAESVSVAHAMGDALAHGATAGSAFVGDCATCGPSETGLAAACAVMLLLIALLGLPFVGRTRWFTETVRSLPRLLPRRAVAPTAPDLTFLCISRT